MIGRYGSEMADESFPLDHITHVEPESKRESGLNFSILSCSMYFGQIFMGITIGPLIALYKSSTLVFLVSAFSSAIAALLGLCIVEYK